MEEFLVCASLLALQVVARAGEGASAVSAGAGRPTCAFYLEKKKRYCNGIHLLPCGYCPVHSPKLLDERIPCPVSSGHTIYKRNLKKHVRFCNATKLRAVLQTQPYYSEGINHGEITRQTNGTTITEPEDYVAFLRLVDETFSRLELERGVLLSEGEDHREDMVMCSDMPRSERHQVQYSQICDKMLHAGLLPPAGPVVFVELGAGRGGLSYSLKQRFPHAKLLLIDRSSTRRKYDRLEAAAEDFVRVRIDLCDLNMAGLPLADVAGQDLRVVGLAKHLCGSATDMSIRALCTLPGGWTAVQGLAIAPCCHHRCTWESYAGKEWLMEQNFQERDFTTLCKLSTWFSIGPPIERVHTTKSIDDHSQNCPRTIAGEDRSWAVNLSADRKIEIGQRCKAILDTGRCKFMERAFGVKISRVVYCAAEVSPENHLLLGARLNKGIDA
jgi:tRNA:m4X modification enzyme